MSSAERPVSVQAEESYQAFVRWWWNNERESLLEWLRNRDVKMVPKPIRAAYRRAGGQLKNQ